MKPWFVPIPAPRVRLMTLEDDQLTVHRKRQGISKLVPVCEDVFADPWAGDMLHGNAQWMIAFDRTDETITGLRVTAAGAAWAQPAFRQAGGAQARSCD